MGHRRGIPSYHVRLHWLLLCRAVVAVVLYRGCATLGLYCSISPWSGLVVCRQESRCAALHLSWGYGDCDPVCGLSVVVVSGGLCGWDGDVELENEGVKRYGQHIGRMNEPGGWARK